MKFFKLLMMSLFLISSVSNAYTVPEDAVIKVFDSSGKQIGEMSRREYKVVKLESEKTEERKAQDRKVIEKWRKSGYSTLIVHGGVGNTDLSVNHNGNSHTVNQRRGAVAGATYCYSLTGLGLCGTVTTNRNYMMGLKFDF